MSDIDTTTTAVTPAADESVQPQPLSPIPKTYDTPEALYKEILERSGLDSFPLDPVDRVVWTSPEGRDPLVFDLNGDSPMGRGSKVQGLFHDEDEIRVYTLPVERGFIYRYTLSKHGLGFVRSRIVNLEAFIDAMAEEYAILGGLDDDEPDDEPEDEEPQS